jgi:hypothetical protein
LIKAGVLTLFQQCLAYGHHLACFWTAILAVIPKPNKADRTSPRSYRPIALLSVLGKGLERLVARKIAWLAISLRIVGNQQFGALPLRSSIDLTTCLTHDVEEALLSGSKALARLVLALPKVESINPIAHPPWIVRESRSEVTKRISSPQGRTKEKAAKDFIDFLPTIPPKDIQVFLDGSKSESIDRATGGGSVTAALLAPLAKLAIDMWVFLDNLEVAMRLLAPSTGSSQSVFDEFCEVACK